MCLQRPPHNHIGWCDGLCALRECGRSWALVPFSESAVDRGCQSCSPRVRQIVGASPVLRECGRSWVLVPFSESAVDRGCQSRSGQTTDYEIGICCFSPEHAAVMSERKNQCIRIRTVCPNGTANSSCCCIDFAIFKFSPACWSSTKKSSSLQKISCYNNAEKQLAWCKDLYSRQSTKEIPALCQKKIPKG